MSKACILLLISLVLARQDVAAVTEKINVVDAQLTLRETDDSITNTIKLNFGEKSSAVLELDHTQKIKLVFKVLDSSRATLRPEQAVVRLTSTQRGSSAYFAAGEAKSSEGLEVVFTAEGIQKQLGTQGGLFEAVLVLGAAAPLVASEWTFATIQVTHRPLPDGTQPPPPSTALERVSQPKPEIKHVFRPPVKRALAIVSLVFTVIVLLPLFAFCLGAFKLGFVPDITSGGAYMMCYHVGLAAILAVYLLFWLRLNLVQTLPILGVLEVLTLATGMKAARSVAKRPKQE